MKWKGFDLAQFGGGRPLPALRSGPAWRRAVAALRARLERAWVGLYAPPPRRLGPMI
jgi:hypothetical protein